MADSWVVANTSMNRERGLRGVNSYAKDLALDPLVLLDNSGDWLDLCCGSGKALVEAADMTCGVRIVGVDLVPMFIPTSHPHLHLIVASLEHWQPDRKFDLITCVHGLHYIGDKLGLIASVVDWLKPGGRFIAHLDLHNLRHADGRDAARTAALRLRSLGFEYDSRRGLLSVCEARTITPFWQFRGADATAGPNRTGQDAVHSCYDFT